MILLQALVLNRKGLDLKIHLNLLFLWVKTGEWSPVAFN